MYSPPAVTTTESTNNLLEFNVYILQTSRDFLNSEHIRVTRRKIENLYSTLCKDINKLKENWYSAIEFSVLELHRSRQQAVDRWCLK